MDAFGIKKFQYADFAEVFPVITVRREDNVGEIVRDNFEREKIRRSLSENDVVRFVYFFSHFRWIDDDGRNFPEFQVH